MVLGPYLNIFLLHFFFLFWILCMQSGKKCNDHCILVFIKFCLSCNWINSFYDYILFILFPMSGTKGVKISNYTQCFDWPQAFGCTLHWISSVLSGIQLGPWIVYGCSSNRLGRLFNFSDRETSFANNFMINFFSFYRKILFISILTCLTSLTNWLWSN